MIHVLMMIRQEYTSGEAVEKLAIDNNNKEILSNQVDSNHIFDIPSNTKLLKVAFSVIDFSTSSLYYMNKGASYYVEIIKKLEWYT